MGTCAHLGPGLETPGSGLATSLPPLQWQKTHCSLELTSIFCTKKAHSRDAGGHLEKSALQETVGFTVYKRLWPASVLNICSSRAQRSTDGRVPTHPGTCCHLPYSFCKRFTSITRGTALCLSYPLITTPWMFPRDSDIVLQGGPVPAIFESSLDGYNGQLSREQWDTKMGKQDFNCCTRQK